MAMTRMKVEQESDEDGYASCEQRIGDSFMKSLTLRYLARAEIACVESGAKP